MLRKIINLLKNGTATAPDSKHTPLFEAIEKCILETERYVYSHSRLPFNNCEEYKKLKELPAGQKIEAVIDLAALSNYYHNRRQDFNHPDRKKYNIVSNLLDAIMRTRLEFPEAFSFTNLFHHLYGRNSLLKKEVSLGDRPFGAFVTQIEKHVKKHGLNHDRRQDIETILKQPSLTPYLKKGAGNNYWGPDIGKAVTKLKCLLHAQGEDGIERVPPYELGSGRFGSIVKDNINSMPSEEQDKWHALFHHLSTASTGKPSMKFITTANSLMDAIGTKQFKTHVNKWFNEAAHLELEKQTHKYPGSNYSYTVYEYIEQHSNNLLKGLLWSMSRFHDAESIQSVAILVAKCFQKIPGQGPAALAVGNAGLYTLAHSKGLAGVSHLSRLKLRIPQNSTRKLIQKYIDEQAARLGIKPAQVEELSVSDYGLEDGQRTEMFDDYKLVLYVTGAGAVELQWFKPDGTLQKSVPAFVKNSESLSAKLKQMRDLAKQIKQAYSTQRDRIDRLYTENMSWDLEAFKKSYLHHGLVSQIARKLIWTLDGQPAIFIDGRWQDIDGNMVRVDDDVTIRLWHPLDSDADTVLAWRDRLEVLQIKQPLKQAYREIYILTDAELNTRIYSNRMAAHILKQHQFNSLASVRGWKYALLGAFDNGTDGDIARKYLPAHKISVQFWINEIIDDNENFNDSGIWYYVATDQVRFCGENDEPLALVDVPPMVFSEVMRDVDLFVGVASVGNDPQWQDGGPDNRADYRDYWQSYSFGDLTEIAKTRKSVLERLLPRLKIRDVATIDGKFLIVKGKKNSYKIHIGSGNILIAPNDRYLCIVPSRGKDKSMEQVFLPFEGDNGLSIVLSKALMLADDDKINDPTILSQL